MPEIKTMTTATIASLLAYQARQLDEQCKGLSEAAATELRRRVKLKTGVYPRTEVEVRVAYSNIPRGGEIEELRAGVIQDFKSMNVLDETPVEDSCHLPSMGIAAHRKLQRFMSGRQWEFVRVLMNQEERVFFLRKMCELVGVIDAMPRTDDTKPLRKWETGALYEPNEKFFPPLFHLHYFKGGAHWYISELDSGAEGDSEEDFMTQCFGHADIFGDGGGIGYVSIPEIVTNGAELDFHWTPKAGTGRSPP